PFCRPGEGLRHGRRPSAGSGGAHRATVAVGHRHNRRLARPAALRHAARHHPSGNRYMAATRIIKKYPNRRLYDTEISSYITIEDVRQLIVDGEDFEVRDAKSGNDLTRSVLLQIIAEQES